MKNGFVDIQNNGWMGTDFAQPGLTVEKVVQITRELVEHGTVAYCPTIITSAPEIYRHNVGVIVQAMKDPQVGRHILGMHLEGPFISPMPGAIGAHPKQHVQDPSIETFEKLQRYAEGNIRILTVAPERPGCLELIRHVVGAGVTVSIGHHFAGDEDMERAVAAGARLCTHLGNGIPNEIHRHNNPLWWQLACDQLSGMFITDGHHLPADMIKVALRAKTPDRFIVTSDASPLAGMPPGKYAIFGDLPVVIDETGLIYSEKSKSLAGSHSTMLECMNHLASLKLLSEEDLWKVGFHNPLKMLGRKAEEFEDLPGLKMAMDKGRFVLKP